MTLTPEWKQAVEKAGDGPVRAEDSETHTAYVARHSDSRRSRHAGLRRSDLVSGDLRRNHVKQVLPPMAGDAAPS